MKRIISTAAAAIALSAIMWGGTPVSHDDLPQQAKKFLAENYPDDNVLKAEKDQGRRGAEYEVDLSSGAEIEFRATGEWKEIKAPRGMPSRQPPCPRQSPLMSPPAPPENPLWKFRADVEDMKWNFPTAPSCA